MIWEILIQRSKKRYSGDENHDRERREKLAQKYHHLQSSAMKLLNLCKTNGYF